MRRPSLVLAAVLTAGLVSVAPAAGAPVQAPKRGGTVVVGPVGQPSCLSPLRAECGGLPLYMQKVLEPAFDLTADFTPRPRLAHATVTRKQPFTVIFEIHPAAHWSDRVPVTASDFVFTHRAIAENRKPADQLEHRYVRSVTPLGAKSVRVVFRTRRATTWRFLFSFVLPAHVLTGQDLSEVWSGVIDNPKTGAPIGSGPFLLQSWQRGEQMTLVRNRNYWGPHAAYLNRVVIRFCRSCGRQLTPSAELLEAFRAGDVDVMQTRDTSILGELGRIPGVEARLAALSALDYLFLRMDTGGHPALETKLIRRALAYGIDREAIARSALGELYERVGVSDNAVVLQTSRFYRPNWQRYRYKPALARRLLEQAGCQRGADRIYVCGDQPLSLRFFAPVLAAHRVRAVELMQEHLRPVGVDVRLTFAPASVVFNQIAPSGNFDAALYAYFGAPDSLAVGILGCGGAANYTGYCQRLVTADLNQSELIVDVEQRARVLNRADARVALDVPLIPLFRVPNVVVFRNTIRNVGSAADHELANAENWWLDD